MPLRTAKNHNWRPLIAIAEVVCGDWPERARAAFTQLTANTDLEAHGRGVLLLSDLREIFATQDTDRLTTATIVEHLNQMEERPWCDERHGHGVHASWLSRKLRPFSIHPGTIRTGVGADETAKGYLLEHFQEAFVRYLPETPSASRHTVTSPVNTGENALFAPVTPNLPVTAQKPDEPIENIGMLRCDGSETPQPDELLL